MIRPFSPEQVLASKREAIPDFVIEAVNRLLVQRFDGRSCVMSQNEVIALAQEICTPGRPAGLMPPRQQFFSNGWLDFEVIFQEMGWQVKYEKPTYDERFEAYWEFKPVNSAPGR